MPLKPLLIPPFALAIVAITFAQSARADDGVYIKALGGASFIVGDDVAITGNATQQSPSYDLGFMGGAALGYAFLDGKWRAEVEYLYRTGQTDDLAANIGSGQFASTSVMANVAYVFDQGPESVWRPYVGVGLGYITEIDFDLERAGTETEFSDRGGVAGQVFVGVEWDLTDSLVVNAEARYFSAGNRTLAACNGQTLKTRYQGADILFGVGYRF